MKKSLILVGMLVIGYANAQEGTVGINTSNPKATLDIQPNATNLAGTTNEGILAPRLSKERIANIATPVEGTLVYATDNTYTGANTKVSKINEKGYYFYNGTEWVKASAGNVLSSNIYTADGTLTGDRKVTMGDKILSFEGNNGAKYLEVKNASWYPLVVNSTNSQGGGIAVHPNSLDNRIEFSVNKEGDMRFYQHGNGDVMFVQKSTNRVGIGTIAPKSKLDVRGGIRAVQGYPQGDGADLGYAFGTDGDTGLFAIADPTNNNVGTGLDLYLNNVSRLNINQQGDVKVTNLSGDGDKIVIANNDGTLVKGVSVNNFATSNIYTADGTLTGDRTVDQAGKWLDFNNGAIRITGNDGVYFPLSINTKHSGGNGGIAINPNGDATKRVELNSTPEGDFRLWADGNRLFIKRDTGSVGIGTNSPTGRLQIVGGTDVSLTSTNSFLMLGSVEGTNIVMDNNEILARNNGEVSVLALQAEGGDLTIGNNITDVSKRYIFTDGKLGIGLTNPKAKLDVNGGIRAVQGYPQGDDTNLGYAFGNDGDTGLFAIADPTNNNLGTGLDLYLNNVSRLNINQQGDVKVTNLSGDGDKIVIANNDGTLVKGVSVNNFATSNIYTADGSTNGDRTVSTANGFLTIKGNSWNPLVVNSEIVPGDPDNNARGGLAVHPNDMEKRVEFATTKDGDSRIWLDGDKVFIKRATGNVGIGTTAPTEKLDVAGSIKSTALAGTGTRVVMADNTGKLVIGTNIRTETTATTLAESDNGGYVYINSSSAVNVTVPSTLPIGFSCVVVQKGTGQVTIVGSGATHETARGTKTRTKHSAIGIIKDTASTFTITGDAIN